MKRVLFLAIIAAIVVCGCGKEDMGEYYPTIGNRELHYVSRSGEVVPFEDDDFDAPVISNTYTNGRGVVTFASPLRKIYFLGSLDITSITIPTSVTEFEGNPFKSCKNLARFISKYSTSDGYALVKDNTLIAVARNYREENFEIAYGVKRIGNSALLGVKIRGIVIPNSVAAIDDNAFAECEELEVLVLPERLQNIGKDVCLDCVNLKEVTLPESITLEGAYGCFVGCDNLERFSGAYASADGRCLVVDKTLYAFAPKDIAEYTIPKGVETIAERSFAECDRLKSITIPASVESIGDGAFYNSSRLDELYIHSTTPPTISGGAGSADPFANLPSDYVIYVPKSSEAKYRADNNWARYEEHIVGKNF